MNYSINQSKKLHATRRPNLTASNSQIYKDSWPFTSFCILAKLSEKGNLKEMVMEEIGDKNYEI